MNDVDEIKSRLNIVEVVGERVTLKNAGRHFKGLCPFHTEKTPSFIVSPDRQSWHCFGCAKGGSVFDFVMAYEHVDFVEALELLAAKAGVTLSRQHPQTEEGKLKEKIYEVNHLASEFYQYLLTKHTLGKRGREYLAERKIKDASTKTFGLGYSPNSWDGLLKFLQKKGYEEELLEKAGLIIRVQGSESRVQSKRYYDRFRGRLMFTLRDHRGNIVGFSGRLLDTESKGLPAGRQEAKYINSPETVAYSKSHMLFGLDVTKESIQKSKEVVVMEGEFDVISSFQEGVGNVVAIKGSALTEGHVHLIRRYAERILFALDSDLAGDAAARRGIEIAEKAGLDMKVVVLPMGKDPDELAHHHPGLLKKSIKDAIPIYDYFIQSALKRHDITTAFGKRKMADELLPLFTKIDNSIVLAHYMKLLATTLGLPEDILSDLFRKIKRGVKETSSSSMPVQDGTLKEKIEKYLLALVLQGDTMPFVEQLISFIPAKELGGGAMQKIIELLEQWRNKPAPFAMQAFIHALPTELASSFDEAYLFDLSDTVDTKEAMHKEWTKTLRAYRREFIREKIASLSKHISTQEEGGEPSDTLTQQLTSYTQLLRTLEKSG